MTSGVGARPRAAMGSLAGFALAMAALHLLGRGALAGPPLGSIEALTSWTAAQDPTVIAMVAVRLAALAMGYHLLLTTVLVVIGRALRAPRLVTFADAMTLPMFRSTAGRLAGLAISASTIVGGGALPSEGATPAPVASFAAPLPTSAGTGPVLIERVALPPSVVPADGTTATIRVVAPPSMPAAPPAPTLHRVRPGDHLWGIAEHAMATALGRAPTDAEVDPFWRQVIAANPDLVDPDLIFPGQLVVVPPVPRAPA